MRFTQDSSSGRHLIRGYAAGELRIDGAVYRGAVIVSASSISSEPDIRDLDELIVALQPPRILALDPEIILLGTGQRQIFPAASFGAQFLRVGIGFEVMDTGAACRTFNVLLAEQRRVVALLLI
jgi:uncharacterized protein